MDSLSALGLEYEIQLFVQHFPTCSCGSENH